MAIVTETHYSIYEELEHRFLYNNDLNSIHILLSLYDLDKNIKNIHPKYISLARVRTSLEESLAYRTDIRELSYQLTRILREDINRLELYICIEAYKSGYFNRKLANKLESLTIENISAERLYNTKYLHHFDPQVAEIKEAKARLYSQISQGLEDKDIYKLVDDYRRLIIGPKLDQLNRYIEAAGLELLEDQEIDKIKTDTYNILMESIEIIYKDSFWYGLNDRVLKRYR